MKAILMVDMPECCGECPCSYYSTYRETYYCNKEKKYLKDVKNIPDWCPLIPYPYSTERYSWPGVKTITIKEGFK